MDIKPLLIGYISIQLGRVCLCKGIGFLFCFCRGEVEERKMGFAMLLYSRHGQIEARGPHAALQRIFAAPRVDLQMCSLVG